MDNTPQGRPGETETNREAIREMIKLKLRDPKLTTRQIGKIVNRDHSTVLRALRRYGIDTKRLDFFKNHRADLYAVKQMDLLEGMTPDKIAKANLQQIGVTLGILNDKEKSERIKTDVSVAFAEMVEIIEREANEERAKIIEIEAL